jgi:hypothetical protein
MARYIYRHSALIISCLLVIAVILVTYTLNYREWSVIVPAVGAILSLSYFLQKQWLDEAHLCKELFTRCNKRYDGLNEQLVLLRESVREGAHLSDKQRQVLFDYFNLCGEEYFWFSEGHIYRRIWKTWLSGMQEYYAVPQIQELWEEELNKGSYYGLSTEILRQQ